MFTFSLRAYTTRFRPCQPGCGSGYCLFRRLCLIIALLIGLPLTAMSAGTGQAAAVADLTPAPYQAGFLSPQNDTSGRHDPYQVAGANGVLFFTAWDSVNGNELWKRDGSAAGPVLVKDINPGAAGANPSMLTMVNGTLFFVADDGSSGAELWRSDGTAAGTVQVRDIVPGVQGSAPWNLTDVAGKLFFSARNGAGDGELWMSDGTTAGTLLLSGGYPKVRFDPFFAAAPRLDNFTAVGARLFFAADDGVNGMELWTSDGTPAGTFMVKDINPASSQSSYPSELTDVNGTLFFRAYHDTSNPASASSLWKSDGTAAGTSLIYDLGQEYAHSFTSSNRKLFFIQSGGLWVSDGTGLGTVPIKEGMSPDQLTDFNGTLYFIMPGQWQAGLRMPARLWKSDGTQAGTVLVCSLFEGSFSNITVVNNTMYFAVENPAVDNPLWKSDGTAAGTAPIPVTLPVAYSSLKNLTDAGGLLTFSAGHYIGFSLWQSDGTVAGTRPVKWPFAPQGSSSLEELTVVNRRLFFTFNDGVHGSELWTSDGTAAGTTLVKDINPGSASSTPSLLTNLNGILFFVADDSSHGAELWRSDGTAAGTTLVKDILPGATSSEPRDLTVFKGALFFVAKDGQQFKLWRSNGTASGTTIVRDIPAYALTDVSGMLLFAASTDPHSVALWKSDGTAVGTIPIKQIACDTSSCYMTISQIIGAGGTIFFRVLNDAGSPSHTQLYSFELWRSDGTAQGTTLLRSFATIIWNPVYSQVPPPASLDHLTVVDKTLFFTARQNGYFNALWRSDGTPSGTIQLTPPGTGSADAPAALTSMNGSLLFTMSAAAVGAELWRSDGTLAGTRLAKDILPGPLDAAPTGLTVSDGQLYFSANDGIRGRELWRSDGSTDGTTLVKDVWPGANGSAPENLTNVNGTLVFSASDGDSGRELWKTDGTPEGTDQVQDIAAGGANSDPAQFTFVGTQLFFVANDGALGRELWSLRSITGVIPREGGALTAWLDHTTYLFPAGAFSSAVTITHTLRDPDTLPPTGRLVSIGRAFETKAVDQVTGQPAQPSTPYTIAVRYTQIERATAIESTLALYYWDGRAWVREPSSALEAASGRIVARPSRFALWSVFGETRRSYLPVIFSRQG
jgi:ELWxxDGT repeat protein